MPTSHFIRTDTYEILDFTAFKAQPEFSDGAVGFPNNPESESNDTIINYYSNPPYIGVLPIARLYDTTPPSLNLWEYAVRPELPAPQHSYDSGENKYYRLWTKKDYTQPELDIINFNNREAVRVQRQHEYMYNVDPLNLMAQDNETTMDAWGAARAQVKIDFPYPAIITLPTP